MSIGTAPPISRIDAPMRSSKTSEPLLVTYSGKNHVASYFLGRRYDKAHPASSAQQAMLEGLSAVMGKRSCARTLRPTGRTQDATGGVLRLFKALVLVD